MKVLLRSLLLLFCIAIFSGCVEETRVLRKDDKHNVSAHLVTSTGADGDTELVVSPFCKSLRAGNRILEEKNWRNWDMAPIYGPDGSVHLFVGRWPVKGSWLKNAQIDHYKAEKPEGPYHRVGTVFKREGVTYCNPQISKLDDRYVLVFMFKEASTPGVQQQIGLATSKSLNGPWKQSRHNPIVYPSLKPGTANCLHASNPTFVHAPDGKYRIYYKSMSDEYPRPYMRTISMAVADNIEGPYENYSGNPLISYADHGLDIEDPYAFYYKGKYYMILEDRMGVAGLLTGKKKPKVIKKGGSRHGLIYKSEDGISWGRPEVGYQSNSFYFQEDTQRFERPHILWKDGQPDYLFLALNRGKYNTSSGAVLKVEQASVDYRRIAVDEYLDKMKAGWVGQMAGVGWGAPTEFKWKSQIIPVEKMPQWEPEMINQFNQDDIYVEMTFVRTLQLHGLDVDIRQAGIDFANSGYRLWHANRFGRENLRKGIAPPDSGHPKFTKHADDIDYQIEADYSGLIAPGMPKVAIELGEKFGRLMNYGDGLYGGQFVGGMYAEAFFEKDMQKIVLAGLSCVPKGSQFHECISDVTKWHRQNPDDWQKTWHLIEAKYQDDPAYRKGSCPWDREGRVNIDAKTNAAYIVMGLLYGDGDIDKTIIISTRCGQDSDCNPSNAAGVLCTTIGFDKLPDKFKSALDPKGKFSHTPYTFGKLIEVCGQLSRQAVKRQGGRVEKDPNGKDVFVIPLQKPKPGRLEQVWQPGPAANSRFTPAEMEKILVKPEKIK